MEDVQYTFTSHKSIEEHGLEVKYTLTYQDKTKEKIFNLNGFRGVNQFDYVFNRDEFLNPAPDSIYWKMALNKDHLNAIAFFAQKYTAADKMDGVDLGEKGWSLALGDTYKDRYELTQTKKN